MTWRWTTLQLVGLALILMLAFGCNPKAPDTPEDMTTTETEVPAPEPEEVTPPPQPEPPPDPEPPEWPTDLRQATDKAYREGLLGEVYFEFDKSDLDAKSRDRLAKNARFLNDNRSFTITIEGHCDERGTNEYNIALGERRSNAAMEYLASLGVSRSRMRTISYGEERPTCTESNEDCWWRNRRAYFLITGTS